MKTLRFVRQTNLFYRIVLADDEDTKQANWEKTAPVFCIVHNRPDAEMLCEAINALPAERKGKRDELLETERAKRKTPVTRYPPGRKPPPLMDKKAFET